MKLHQTKSSHNSFPLRHSNSSPRKRSSKCKWSLKQLVLSTAVIVLVLYLVTFLVSISYVDMFSYNDITNSNGNSVPDTDPLVTTKINVPTNSPSNYPFNYPSKDVINRHRASDNRKSDVQSPESNTNSAQAMEVKDKEGLKVSTSTIGSTSVLNGVVVWNENILKSVKSHTKTILDFGVRVPDSTDGYIRTKEYLLNESKQWHHANSYFHSQAAQTPLGRKTFSNFIVEFGDRNALPKKEIILSAHYESKLIETHPINRKEFLGAIDSVVSCAMLIELASWIEQHWENVGKTLPFHLTFVFFDGEEAFVDWTWKDSLYGSRALAKKWTKENRLKNIELLILLDLVGGANAQYLNYPFHPQKYFHSLIKSEQQMRTYFQHFHQRTQVSNDSKDTKDAQDTNDILDAQTLQASKNAHSSESSKASEQNTKSYFKSNRGPPYIDDDHTPFLMKGVPIIHLIPYPFPDVWHTHDDDWEHIDWESVERIHASLMQFIVSLQG